MAQWNSDGYIMIDFESVDFRRTNQTIEGLFNRLDLVYKTNKVVFIINAHSKSPLVGVVSIVNGQYVIETNIYTFSITIDDNLHIKRNDVPASDIIDDTVISADKAWSSYKVNEELETKADTSDLSDYQPLLTAGDNITIDENNVISATGGGGSGAQIDDTVIVNNKTWSSLKINNELSTKADTSDLSDYQPLLTAGDNISISSNNEISADVSAVINDTTASATTTYSSNKVDNIIGGIIKSFTYVGNGNTTNNIVFPEAPTLILSIGGLGSISAYMKTLSAPIVWNKDTILVGGVLGYSPVTVTVFGDEISFNDKTMTIVGSQATRAFNGNDYIYTVYYI